jgi:hypothetical protein
MPGAMTPERQRQRARVFRGSLLAVPLVLVAGWLWTRPERAGTRFDDALDQALAPVLQQSDVQQTLGAAGSTRATRVLARESAQRSVAFLAPRDLELWAATRAQVAQASKPACARLWKGGDEALFGATLAELGSDALQDYAQMLARALALRLERKPPPAFASDVVQRGFAAVAAQLPASERAPFEADVQRRDVSDERACQLFVTLSRGAEKLEPALRVDFYRALASQLPVVH